MTCKLSLILLLTVIFTQTALSQPFQFRHHFITHDLPGGGWGQTALADIDRDGDLDLITGQQFKDVYWFEFTKGEAWKKHLLGKDSPSDVGGAAMDVDGDGRIDYVAGGAWYKQPETLTDEPWQRFVFDDVPSVHDLITADIDGDGKDDVITMSDRNDVRWYKIPADPTQPWTHTRICDPVHAGISAGDIDGDGDIDLVRTQIWLENVDHGKEWIEHPFCGVEWANRKDVAFYYRASRSWVVDINRDGRKDIVLTEGEFSGARIAWFEAPEDPKQVPWTVHFLPFSPDEGRDPFHTLQVADFNNDGLPDIFAGEMEHLGNLPHNWYLWQNNVPESGEFIEHTILSENIGTHEARAADIDGDGDIDIVGKPWRPNPNNGIGGKNHADFLENLLF